MKAATILFGRSAPEPEMRRAHDATMGRDLFIAIGSLLVVYPGAGFPITASQNGADLVINDEISPVMADVVGLTNSDMIRLQKMIAGAAWAMIVPNISKS